MQLHLPFSVAAWLPVRASTLAPRVDTIFAGLLLACTTMVVLLLVLNLTWLIRYRRGSKADRRPVRISEWKFEAAWIAATTLIFLGFFFWGAKVYLFEEHAPAGAREISVTGRQWMWDIRQPNGRREFDTLHVPAGEDIRLMLTSEDVIHSFFVPAFRIKQDVVPGKRVSLWFNANAPGTYPIFCSQYCGTKHSAMIGHIIVLPPSEYANWLGSGQGATDSLLRGRSLFVKYNCSACHDQPSPIHAPPLEHVFGSQIPVQDGHFVRADETYLRDSILLPTKDIVAGYQPIMPSFKGVIPESDLLELIAYLKSLAGESARSSASSPSP
jgi:cytochrome c oxidase subunit II